jgi:hypothetical protein
MQTLPAEIELLGVTFALSCRSRAVCCFLVSDVGTGRSNSEAVDAVLGLLLAADDVDHVGKVT